LKLLNEQAKKFYSLPKALQEKLIRMVADIDYQNMTYGDDPHIPYEFVGDEYFQLLNVFTDMSLYHDMGEDALFSDGWNAVLDLLYWMTSGKVTVEFRNDAIKQMVLDSAIEKINIGDLREFAPADTLCVEINASVSHMIGDESNMMRIGYEISYCSVQFRADHAHFCATMIMTDAMGNALTKMPTQIFWDFKYSEDINATIERLLSTIDELHGAEATYGEKRLDTLATEVCIRHVFGALAFIASAQQESSLVEHKPMRAHALTIDPVKEKKKLTKAVTARSVYILNPPKQTEGSSSASSPSKDRAPSLVRGHFRKQKVGEGRKSIRIIWIKPHWRSLKEGEVAQNEKKIIL
jgi:hypothetical protein